MIQRKAGWDRTHVHFVGEPMREHCLARMTTNVEESVSHVVFSARPHEACARNDRNFRCESVEITFGDFVPGEFHHG
jgi:hypothetical protein